MNRKIYIAAGFLLGVLAIVVFAILLNPSVSEPQAYNKTIEVSGTGIVKATPDEAHLMIAVVSEALTAQKAAEMNSENMTGVFNELKKAGIPEAKTMQYSIAPVYKWVEEETIQGREKKSVIVGYRATNLIKVICKPEEAGKAIDASIKGGANQIDSISFQLSEELSDKTYSDALRKAIRNGKSKAEVAAEELRVMDIYLIRLSTGDDYVRYTYPVEFRATQEGAAPTPVTPSEVEVRANVQIVYAF